ncbi:MAG: MCE family protein [Ignavibacteriae bacterium]|nr:MCE family protein [Ignavibacteriota bacterium]
MKQQLSRARVGFLIFVGVITFVVAIFLVGEKTQMFSSTFTVLVNFSSAEGVKPGSYVVLSGYTVGSVTDISLSEDADSVRLELRLDESVRPFIKADTKAEIKQEGLVGNKIINLIIGSPALPSVGNNDFIQGVPPFALTGLADNVSAITDTSKIIASEIKTLLVRLNNGDGFLGRLLRDDALYADLAGITGKVDSGLTIATSQLVRLTDILQRVTKNVDGLVQRSDSTLGTVNDATRELAVLLENLNNGRGTAGALLTDRKLYDSLVTLVGSFNDVAYDAGNAANQLTQSIYAMRQHWLLGRVFGGDDIDTAPAPTPAYQKIMRELRARTAELDKREARIRELERALQAPEPSKQGQ